MPLILNIDTALETASICLAKNGIVLHTAANKEQKDHASWLQTAIAELIQISEFELKDINAIAVTIGPGSYTGLRVGLSSAKGLCYALNIPLIAVSTLELMAYAAQNLEADLLCPMIDARRMEVYTAVYTKSLKEVIRPHAMVLNKDFLSGLLNSNTILIFGNGSNKSLAFLNHGNAIFAEVFFDASNMATMTLEYFVLGRFADIAYCEPAYLKEFFHLPASH
ncbi:MAG: tRNA (adenosine(37)-N6)-threonylcarbamoyltransferase complex dimerization subunit type 1 TsaB [Bacteroidetes bacterium]|nr:tRNA (adenosine(37)-N6)-threonylcarbamoyltransferase complex dimerization subunit type 1 TsaB [Bacteroidota bacterium]MBS1931556.1 tRNA (adenosine(37)-N6)-threonylcarbamoyltransferase complex dimerization subunit type 1 TsaB [Bacteroidota bacterium]